MSDFAAVRRNVIRAPAYRDDPYQRIFVLSAYGGITDALLEHKKTGKPGVYALFSNADDEGDWEEALEDLRTRLHQINFDLFSDKALQDRSLAFIDERLDDAKRCLSDLQRLCQHGHFELETHLHTVREMLASIGEAHSAWNTTQLLQQDGIAARFVDLSGWRADEHIGLDERIERAFAEIDLARELPIVTGYTHSSDGLMATFDRGYSEMTFSRIAVLTGAREAVIHKEYHLSSADPRLVGPDNTVPIGRTNYDVADQLANLGMEAIHPRAAKGLRQHGIPLRIKNTFEPEHEGTLVTADYISDTPCVEIIAGRKSVYAVECFDQDMAGGMAAYDKALLEHVMRYKAGVITKDVNANTVTHYLSANLKIVKRIRGAIEKQFPDSEIQVRKVAVVSAIGSDMKIPGMLKQTVSALSDAGISILAMHQSMRQVDMQFIVNEADYDAAVKNLHRCLIEVHDHGESIAALAC